SRQGLAHPVLHSHPLYADQTAGQGQILLGTKARNSPPLRGTKRVRLISVPISAAGTRSLLVTKERLDHLVKLLLLGEGIKRLALIGRLSSAVGPLDHRPIAETEGLWGGDDRREVFGAGIHTTGQTGNGIRRRNEQRFPFGITEARPQVVSHARTR